MKNSNAPAVDQQRLVRRFTIDFRAIAAETGCTKGTIGHNSMFGWHVQNGNGPADFCTFTPPEIAERETLRIEGREWAVYSANAEAQRAGDSRYAEPPCSTIGGTSCE
jgi:hypothetical protein